MSMYDIIELLSVSNRSNWKELITPYILEVNMEDRISLIGKDIEDSDYFAFIPEELNPNFKWPFNVGDTVTDGKDVMIITGLPELDPRKSILYDQDRVIEYGNRYSVVKIDKNKKDKDANNPWAYLNQKFNINQIHLATKEEIEQIFSKE